MKLFFVSIFLALTLIFFPQNSYAQQSGSLGGQVYDSLGALVVGATITVVDSANKVKTAQTNGQGQFVVTGLASGKYTVRATAPQFSVYENTEVMIQAGKREELTIALDIAAVREEVEVGNEGKISTDPEASAGATVLKGKDLDALPDDPDELEAALQALAGPSAGPNGGQFYIDGFTGGRIPPKDAIREIRINQNPFSAEYDRLGFGRVEILTKPGYGKFSGQANFNFNDARLNSRNPFASNRAPSQQKTYGAYFSGPIQKNK
jgi:hypothetical protein